MFKLRSVSFDPSKAMQLQASTIQAFISDPFLHSLAVASVVGPLGSLKSEASRVVKSTQEEFVSTSPLPHFLLLQSSHLAVPFWVPSLMPRSGLAFGKRLG